MAKGPKFTEPTPKGPKALKHPHRNLYPELRQARGETIMTYAVFCGMGRDNIETMLDQQAKQNGERMKRVKK